MWADSSAFYCATAASGLPLWEATPRGLIWGQRVAGPAPYGPIAAATCDLPLWEATGRVIRGWHQPSSSRCWLPLPPYLIAVPSFRPVAPALAGLEQPLRWPQPSPLKSHSAIWAICMLHFYYVDYHTSCFFFHAPFHILGFVTYIALILIPKELLLLVYL